ncbi:hypothetical protein RHSIM_Rhsim03G0072100 [Rhododendron simsii]|uniref:Uncharacterized protein n=1 Tax=Rhododendron simsii TaxID=118357 RepID=A0A834LU10_RHOSS|nr:hypothetical protein RHSIM_Rhsim03G0072100 [Rhododendron simsii]
MRNSKLKSSIRRKVQVFDSDEALAKYIADLSDKFAKESYAFTVVLSGVWKEYDARVNQKMILTLTASIMYWSLQQPVEGSESSPSLSPSIATSINGEDKSSLIGEVSKLTMDDTAFDTTVTSQVENEITSGASIYRVLSLVQS